MTATTDSSNPCCAALRLRCSNLKEKRDSLREGCRLMKDEVIRLQGVIRDLEIAYNEEHARVDHERNLKVEETAFRISAESKVSELESQLSLQQAGCPLCLNLDKEMVILLKKVSEREGRIDWLKQLLDEETKKDDAEKETDKTDMQKSLEFNEALEGRIDWLKQLLDEETEKDDVEEVTDKMVKQKSLEFNEALENENNRSDETVPCNHVEAKTIDDSESNKAMLLQYKELADEYERKFTEEQSYAKNLLKQVEEESRKVEVLEKNVLASTSFRESVEAELNQLRDLFKVEQSRADAEQEKAVKLQATLDLEKKKSIESSSLAQAELKITKESIGMTERLKNEASEKLTFEQSKYEEMTKKYEVEKKKVLMERQRADAEQKKAAELQVTLELAKEKYLESSSLAQAELKKVRESLVSMERLKSETSILTFKQSKYEEMTKKYETEKQNVLMERQRADTEVVKALELKNLVEEYDKKVIEEKSNSVQLLQNIEEERQKVGRLQKQVQELFPSGKLTAEQMTLEKKRLKHAKQVIKLEKDRNYVLQRLLGKLEQAFLQIFQPLDLLENTISGGTQAVNESTKSSDLSKLLSIFWNKMLFGIKLFETMVSGFVVCSSSAICALGSGIPSALCSQQDNNTVSPSGITPKLHPMMGGGLQEISSNSALDTSAAAFPDKWLLASQEQAAGSLATSNINQVDGNPNPQISISKFSGKAGKTKCSEIAASLRDKDSRTPLDGVLFAHDQKRKLLLEFESLKYMQFESRRLHGELEEKLSKMHSKLNRLMGAPMEDTRCLLPDKVAAKLGVPCKKRKVSRKSEETLELSHDLTELLTPAVLPPRKEGGSVRACKKRKVSSKLEETCKQSHRPAKQTKRDKLLAPAGLPAIEDGGSTRACVGYISDQDTLLDFERQIGGSVMKLLELDNKVLEIMFQDAIENPLSPYLPEVNCENSEQIGINRSGCVGENLLFGVGTMVPSVPVSSNGCSKDNLNVGSSQPPDILSVLVTELWKCASVHIDVLDSSSRFSVPENAPNEDIDSYINIMASVELVSVTMGWSWTTERVLPELQTLLQSSIQGSFYTSLILLLGRIGRFGVKSCGFEDAGVRSIRQYLNSLLQQISLSGHDHVAASAVLFALGSISLHKEGTQNKLDRCTGLSTSSTFTKAYSLLSSEHKGLISTLNISQIPSNSVPSGLVSYVRCPCTSSFCPVLPTVDASTQIVPWIYSSFPLLPTC